MLDHLIRLLPAIAIFIFQQKIIWKKLVATYNPDDTILEKNKYSVTETWIWIIAYEIIRWLLILQIFLEIWPISTYQPIKQIFLIIGYSLMAIGFAIYLIGSKTLGSNWTGNLKFRIKKDQKLITSGIYKYFRHPIYLGTFLEIVGYQLIANSWLVLPVTIVSSSLFLWQIKREETLLLKHYHQQYANYRQTTF